MVKRVSSGSEIIDKLLNGGFEADAITTIYGPFSSGKTNICMLCAISVVKNGKKVVYVDTESSFSVERLKQLDPDYENTLKDIIFLKPTSFETQNKIFQKLKTLVDDSIGVVIIDSIAMFYRLKVGTKDENIYDVNREMKLQLYNLADISRLKNIPVIITNQVYSSFEHPDQVKMVGGDLLAYGSKCLIELQKGRKNIRKAILRRHRSLPEEKEVMLRIEEGGLVEVVE